MIARRRVTGRVSLVIRLFRMICSTRRTSGMCLKPANCQAKTLSPTPENSRFPEPSGRSTRTRFLTCPRATAWTRIASPLGLGRPDDGTSIGDGVTNVREPAPLGPSVVPTLRSRPPQYRADRKADEAASHRGIISGDAAFREEQP